MTAFMIAYVVINVGIKKPDNLRSLIGLFGFPLLLFFTSKNMKQVILTDQKG